MTQEEPPRGWTLRWPIGGVPVAVADPGAPARHGPALGAPLWIASSDVEPPRAARLHACPGLAALSLDDTIGLARALERQARVGISIVALGPSAPLPEALVASYLVWTGARTRLALNAAMRDVSPGAPRAESEALVWRLGRHLGR
jgi:hypothetical protein